MKRAGFKPNPAQSQAWQERSRKRARERAPKPRKALKKVSPKQQARNDEFAIQAAQFMSENPWCLKCADTGLETPACDPHHQMGRDGALLFDFSKIIPLCRRCHDTMKANGKAAIAAGYSLSRHRTA